LWREHEVCAMDPNTLITWLMGLIFLLLLLAGL
jgi:hypothetical protein